MNSDEKLGTALLVLFWLFICYLYTPLHYMCHNTYYQKIPDDDNDNNDNNV